MLETGFAQDFGAGSRAAAAESGDAPRSTGDDARGSAECVGPLC